jgi:hypothetical protein
MSRASEIYCLTHPSFSWQTGEECKNIHVMHNEMRCDHLHCSVDWNFSCDISHFLCVCVFVLWLVFLRAPVLYIVAYSISRRHN